MTTIIYARVGQDSEAWKGVLGKQWSREMQGHGTPTAGVLHRAPTYHHQHNLPAEKQP